MNYFNENENIVIFDCEKNGNSLEEFLTEKRYLPDYLESYVDIKTY